MSNGRYERPYDHDGDPRDEYDGKEQRLPHSQHMSRAQYPALPPSPVMSCAPCQRLPPSAVVPCGLPYPWGSNPEGAQSMHGFWESRTFPQSQVMDPAVAAPAAASPPCAVTEYARPYHTGERPALGSAPPPPIGVWSQAQPTPVPASPSDAHETHLNNPLSADPPLLPRLPQG